MTVSFVKPFESTFFLSWAVAVLVLSSCGLQNDSEEPAPSRGLGDIQQVVNVASDPGCYHSGDTASKLLDTNSNQKISLREYQTFYNRSVAILQRILAGGRAASAAELRRYDASAPFGQFSVIDIYAGASAYAIYRNKCFPHPATPRPTRISEDEYEILPSADSTIRSNVTVLSEYNYGARQLLITYQNDNSSNQKGQIDALLRYSLSGANFDRPIVGAYLKLDVSNPARHGGDLYSVADNQWIEDEVDSSNAPPHSGRPIASLGRTSRGIKLIDVSSVVYSGKDIYNFKIVGRSITDNQGNQIPDGMEFGSRESNSPPKLIIKLKPNRPESCGPHGVLVAGSCWYLGQGSCTEICGSKGYDDATRTYAGSDGSGANCANVITALAAAGECPKWTWNNIFNSDTCYYTSFFDSQQATAFTPGVGCGWVLTTGPSILYQNASRTTADANFQIPESSYVGKYRVCACKE